MKTPLQPRFLALADAAPRFGYNNGPSMRKAFERGHLPLEALHRVGDRTLRVDVEVLERWLTTRPAYGNGTGPIEVKIIETAREVAP